MASKRDILLLKSIVGLDDAFIKAFTTEGVVSKLQKRQNRSESSIG